MCCLADATRFLVSSFPAAWQSSSDDHEADGIFTMIEPSFIKPFQ
jgi:hypothetical protein